MDGVTWDGLPMYLPLCGFVENSRIVIQVINEDDYTCLYDWAQGLNFSLVGKKPRDFVFPLILSVDSELLKYIIYVLLYLLYFAITFLYPFDLNEIYLE